MTLYLCTVSVTRCVELCAAGSPARFSNLNLAVFVSLSKQASLVAVRGGNKALAQVLFESLGEIVHREDRPHMRSPSLTLAPPTLLLPT